MPIFRLSHDFSQFEKLKVTQKVLYAHSANDHVLQSVFLETK